MPNRDKDEMARALEALSAGHHQDEAEHDGTEASGAQAPVPPPAEPPARVVARGPVSRPTNPSSSATPPRPQAPTAARPAGPAQSRPTSSAPAQNRPAQPNTSAAPQRPTQPNPAAARPAAPQRPAATQRPAGPAQQPPARSATPTARPANPAAARPAAPTAARPPTPSAGRPTRPTAPAAKPAAPIAQPAYQEPAAATIDDDDQVIVPAPDASVFFHKPEAAPKPQGLAFGQSISFRQTLIPILLTGGLIMLGLGSLRFIWQSENNPLIALPLVLVIILFVFGVGLWGLAVANMIVVKQILDRRKATG